MQLINSRPIFTSSIDSDSQSIAVEGGGEGEEAERAETDEGTDFKRRCGRNRKTLPFSDPGGSV